MEPSGLAWVQRFPGSVSLDDLVPEFRDRVRAFLRALKDGGAKVRIAATYRPPGEGLARVTVVDADGRSDTSEIRFKKLR